MRPNVLLACSWALCSYALVAAQTPDQRPSGLRDAGVISRAMPPTSLGPGAANSTAQNVAQPGATPASTNFPAAPTNESTVASLGDRAWTSSPSQSRAAGRIADTTTPPTFPSQVVPAQFTSQPAPNSVAQANQALTVRPASGNTATGNTVSNHEPRPLKPPKVSETNANGKGSTGTVQMFISVFSSLAIVIGLILASAWFYRKAAPTISGALPKQVVQVLGRTPLAPRQQLVLLRLGSKLVLVSNLHGEVRTISEITDPLEVDRLAGLCEAAQPGSISDSFRSVLHNIGRNG